MRSGQGGDTAGYFFGRRESWRGRSGAIAVLACLLLATIEVAAARGAVATLFVDRSNPSCNDSGPGTAGTPFCTIARAGSVAVAGQTVLVASGTYPERIVIANSGTSGSPIIFQPAPGASVTVSGQANGFVTFAQSWITVSGFTITGTTSYGIYLWNSTNITLSGNHVSNAGQPVNGSTAAGMYITGTTDSLIVGNTTDHNSDAGIYLTNNSTRDEIRNNVSFSNARGYVMAAPGIDVRAPGNLIDGNTCYSNEDTGVQIYPGGDNSTIVNNVIYGNGDYGIDVLNAPGSTIVSNSSYNNHKSGINVEGTSSGARLANNISVQNGYTTGKGNIRVDPQSTPGSAIDYDIVKLYQAGWNIVWGTNNYTALADFKAATGQETHGLEADPKWVAPDSGDFHLQSGSPGIDSADSSAPAELSFDRDGNPRVDDPATANTGVGPRGYDDRGAYEFQTGSDQAPLASLSVSPPGGPAPVLVTADASGSTDTDATPISTYTFDFGDGTVVGPQAAATATHNYTVAGSYTVTVTVTDTAGLKGTAQKTVSVVTEQAPVASLSLSPPGGTAPVLVTADASGSTDTDATPISTYTFDFGDGTVVGPQAAATTTHNYTASGTYTVTVTVIDTAGLKGTASKQLVVSPDLPPAATLTVTPSTGPFPLAVTANAAGSTDTDATPISTYTFNFGDGTVVGPQPGATATHTYGAAGTYTVIVTVTDTGGKQGTAQKQVLAVDNAPVATLTVTPTSANVSLPVTADASGSTDTDGTPIATYTFNFGDGTVTGPQPGSVATHAYTARGTYTVTVTVTDTGGKQGTAQKPVKVSTEYVTNPGFETDTAGWAAIGPAASMARVAGGHSGGWAAALTNTGSTTSSCGITDSPNWVQTTAGGTYTAQLWVRGPRNGGNTRLTFAIQEFVGSTSVGSVSKTVKIIASWQHLTLTYTAARPGASTLDFSANVAQAAPGTCFYADDASITLS